MREHSMTKTTDTECVRIRVVYGFQIYLICEEGYETLSKNVITATLREHSLVNTAHQIVSDTVHRLDVTSRRFNHSTVKVGLYFRRRQALCRAFTRLSNARESVSGVPVYTSHADISARQRAPESVARRKMLQSSTVLNFRASRQQFSQSCTGVTN